MSWIDNINDEVSTGYSWGGISDLTQAGRGLFGDALGAWVTVEKVKGMKESQAASQTATRDTATYPSGSQAPQQAGTGLTGGAGLTPAHLMVGGALLAGLFLIARG
ncbi:hypothetical protein [Halomonas sp. NO4]|uniref:hypothetical protein n=1 Tax=Halomonas sp. NO4 TaxID=2484813 RepID=UPI0013D1811A|nr:hypothetical protein [Halomonas sp. NO4]